VTFLKRLVRAPFLSSGLLVLWLALSRDASPGQVLIGLAVALVVPLMASKLRPTTVHVRRPLAIARFILAQNLDRITMRDLMRYGPPALRSPEERQARADVCVPEGVHGAAVRDEELEGRDPAPRPDDACELPKRRRRIVDVPKQVGERDPVEASVCEGELFGTRLSEIDPRAFPGAHDAALRFREHRGTLIDSDDRAAEAADELERDGGRSARDVEDSVAWRGLDTRDEE